MTHPPGYYRYFELFNAGEYWEAHEALEEVWRETGDRFLRGLIVFAAAFVHVQRNNPSGCRKVLEKCVAWLTPYRPRRWGLDVDRVVAHSELCLERLRSLPEERPLAEHLPPIQLRLEPGET